MMKRPGRQSERGAVTLVEAVFVFPIMFFIVFFMLMAGSAYFQKARIERIISEATIEACARSENPMLDAIGTTGSSVPTSTTAAEIKPYRQLFPGHTNSVRNNVQASIQKSIKAFGSLGFTGMQAKLEGEPVMDVKYRLIISSITTRCNFKVELPIRMIFSNKKLSFRFSTVTKDVVGDPTEFVRNVAMVKDYVERSKNFMEWAEKISSGLKKIATYTN